MKHQVTRKKWIEATPPSALLRLRLLRRSAHLLLGLLGHLPSLRRNGGIFGIPPTWCNHEPIARSNRKKLVLRDPDYTILYNICHSGTALSQELHAGLFCVVALKSNAWRETLCTLMSNVQLNLATAYSFYHPRASFSRVFYFIPLPLLTSPTTVALVELGVDGGRLRRNLSRHSTVAT